jgi:phage major head subunit gpT-like protein
MDEEAVNKFVSTSKPKVVALTEKKLTPDLIKALSIAYETNLTFGVIRGNKQHQNIWTKRFEVSSLPAVIVLRGQQHVGSNHIMGHIYDGPTFYDDLFEDLWPLLNASNAATGGINDRAFYLTDGGRAAAEASSPNDSQNDVPHGNS